MAEHDGRCEARWNDGECACIDRAENAQHGFNADHSADPCGLIRRIFRLHN